MTGASNLFGADSNTVSSPLASRSPHQAARATNVIQIFCPGGMSHVDTWDYKPELERQHGKPFDPELGKQTFAGIGGNYAKGFWPFRQHGECGRWLSDLFPRLASHVDDMLSSIRCRASRRCMGRRCSWPTAGSFGPAFRAWGRG